MSKVWEYPTSYSYVIVKDNIEISVLTELYPMGIYYIINGNPGLQGGTTPNKLARTLKQLKKDEQAGKIKDLKIGRIIKVTKGEDGIYKQIE
jgi:hypothetical protein